MTITLTQAQKLTIRNLHDEPLLLVKERHCKIQTGTIKIIHPINLSSIEETAEILIKSSYHNNAETTNPLTNILKYKAKKLYSNIYQLKPQPHHRSRRWNAVGTVWKWIAGTPDASDLQAINTTMNDLIDQNNQQIIVNQNLNTRIQQLTHAIQEVTNQANLNDLLMDDIETITSIVNVDILNQLLEDIQDAILLSIMSITSNKILSIREITTIRELLQDQGINIHLPDEALQYVTPKFATSHGTLLYFMHVPLLEENTAEIIRIYTIINSNQSIIQFPEFIVKSGNRIFVTQKPEDFVQKSSFLTDLGDECIKPLITGVKPKCNVVFNNQTIIKLISDNTILISNIRNQTLKSTCGPDNRSLEGNVIINFENCTIQLNNETFRNEEYIGEPNIMYNAFYNLKPNWKLQEDIDLGKIHHDTIQNRRHLEHVYLEQNNLNFKFWSLFGGFSFTGITAVIIIMLIIIRYGGKGPGRSSLREGEVIASVCPNSEEAILSQLGDIQQQQQQLATSLATLNEPHNGR